MWIMVNGSGHKKLDIIDAIRGERPGTVDAPPGNTFDNQFWPNHQDWMVSVVEEGALDVFIHQISTNRSWRRMTDFGDCNRPDLSLDVTREK